MHCPRQPVWRRRSVQERVGTSRPFAPHSNLHLPSSSASRRSAAPIMGLHPHQSAARARPRAESRAGSRRVESLQHAGRAAHDRWRACTRAKSAIVTGITGRRVPLQEKQDPVGAGHRPPPARAGSGDQPVRSRAPRRDPDRDGILAAIGAGVTLDGKSIITSDGPSTGRVPKSWRGSGAVGVSSRPSSGGSAAR
jgi:hypothetical protein